MNIVDVQILMKDVSSVVKSFVKEELNKVDAKLVALQQENAELRKSLSDMQVHIATVEGIRGQDGKDGVDGKSVTMDEVLPVLERIVTEKVKSIPTPKDGADGKDGRDGTSVAIDSVMLEILPVIKAGIDSVENDLRTELKAEITEFIETLPIPKDGVDGKSVTLEDVTPMLGELVNKAVAAIPVPKDGKDGRDGVDGKDGRDGIDGEKGLDGKDGRDGVDGKNGNDGVSVDIKEVELIVIKQVDSAVSKIPKAENGRDGRDGLPGVPGRDGEKGAPGTDGRDGKDGLSLEDIDVVMSDDFHELTFMLNNGQKSVQKTIRLPVPVYDGVWKEPNFYTRGTVVTYSGSLWIALKDTEKGSRPGTNKDWQLCVKKGEVGKPGEKGAPGRDGSNGRDLTQLGPDGRRW